jgi:general secretion pathway protein J
MVARALFMRGITLLELLIALTLLGLISVMLYGGLYLGTRSSELGISRADATERIRLIQSFIRREVSQAYPLLWKNKGKQRVAFRGESQRLHFAAILPPHRGIGGLYLVSIEMTPRLQGSELVFSYRLATPEIQGFEVGAEPDERVVLLENVEEVEFAYYGNQEKEEEARWQARWKDPKRLPRLVRLRVKTGDTSFWPELVIPLYAKVHPNEVQLVIQAPGESGTGETEPLDEDIGDTEEE